MDVIDASDVSAVIVTRGDVDLTPILATLPYDETIVWDDRQLGSQGCYGRYLAAAEARNDVVYFQDDDLIFTAHTDLLAAYEPGRITANMPSPWYENTGYDLLGCTLVGAGALVPRDLPWEAFNRYLADWPLDELFLTYCDQVVGLLTSGARFDFGYQVLPYASDPDRIYTQPGAQARKMIVQARALAIREQVAA